MEQVTVRVPASTSNLGPGFDCLGVALRIYNDVTVRRGRGGRLSPMMRAAADAFFAQAKCRRFPISCTISGEVPVSRGLGSSVTVRLGLLHGLNELANKPLTRQKLFELCAQLEGHPDNAAPAQFGGFNVIGSRSRQRFAVSAALQFVLLVPSFEVSTAEARALLPVRLGRVEAIESCANACVLTAAFATRRYEHLRGAFRDQLHQPFRKHLIPNFDAMLAAAEQAGALGAFLSGSGSTIAAVTLKDAAGVADAMRAAGPPDARTLVTNADNRGARILPIEIRNSEIENSK